MKGRNPTANEKRHMDMVSQIGCIVCKNQGNYFVPTEIHHTEGKTKEEAHFKVLPLCYEHHRQGVMNGMWVSRHPWKKEFEKRYGTELELLKQVKEILDET